MDSRDSWHSCAISGEVCGMKIGYARISAKEENIELQLNALSAAGCEHIFKDRGGSGVNSPRLGLGRALRAVNRGDVLVVWKLHRLGRSMTHLIKLIRRLRDSGVGLELLQEKIDTTGPGGPYYFQMFEALAEFQREAMTEYTKAGMAAAQRRGHHVGRPRKLGGKEIDAARSLLAKGVAREAVAAELNVSVATLRRVLRGD